MSLLQNPVKVLDQIDWYLTHQGEERFPGAFLLAAGNLARQTLEQVLFILAFYSGMPSDQYMRSNWQLRTADRVLTALRHPNPLTGHTYLVEARRRGTRIRKFARYPRSLDKWRSLFNELSHFRNPAARRYTREMHIAEFSKRMRRIVDDRDHFLILAAVNQLRSGGRIRATLGTDKLNLPGLIIDQIVKPEHLVRTEGGWQLMPPPFEVTVVPMDMEVPYRWKSTIVLIQGSEGMTMQSRWITEGGHPVDLTNLGTIVQSLAHTADYRRRLARHMKRQGVEIEFRPPPEHTSSAAKGT